MTLIYVLIWANITYIRVQQFKTAEFYDVENKMTLIDSLFKCKLVVFGNIDQIDNSLGIYNLYLLLHFLQVTHSLMPMPWWMQYWILGRLVKS